MNNRQLYVNLCINKRGTNEIWNNTNGFIFLDHSLIRDYKVLKMMCNYWKVDLKTGFHMLSNYIVTGNESGK